MGSQGGKWGILEVLAGCYLQRIARVSIGGLNAPGYPLALPSVSSDSGTA